MIGVETYPYHVFRHAVRHACHDDVVRHAVHHACHDHDDVYL